MTPDESGGDPPPPAWPAGRTIPRLDGLSPGGHPVPVIETDRLLLRAFREDDAPPFHQILRRPEVRDALLMESEPDPLRAWSEMAAWLGQWHLRGTGHWALEDLETGRLVGRVGLHNPPRPGWPGLEVGWTLHPSVWGRGYASEAGAAAMAYAFTTFSVDRLCATILPDNTRSQRVAHRLGLHRGERVVLPNLPDDPVDIWWISRSDWTQPQ